MSIFKGIRKLPAAHLLTIDNGEVKTRRYWNLSWQKPQLNGRSGLDEKASELKNLISDAVRLRLVSDVPLGVLLSGGIDSSTVAAFAAQHSTEKVKTFTIGFEEDSFDESKYARLAAQHLGTDHYEDRLSAEKAGDLISDIGGWLDEPLSDASLIPTYLLSRFVRQHVTVALGGDGGDEIFAGYPMYPGHQVAEIYTAVPRFVRTALVEPLVSALPVSTKNLSFDYKAKRFVASARFDPVTRHHSWFGSFWIDEQERLLTKEVRDATQADIYRGAKELLHICDATELIERMQFIDMNFYMAEDILTKVDRASMAVSLETRAPFLDPRIAEFAASLPLSYKLRRQKGKIILKQSVKELLPPEILDRPKKGFGIPIADWLKKRLNPLLHDLLAPQRLKEQGLFDSDYVQKLIVEHESGRASRHKELWTLLVFQLWFNNFLNVRR
jgi:asparagine synthase (glutamine-hydrolysing)